MDEPAQDAAVTLRPILVFRSKIARPARREAHESPSVLKQYDNIRQFAAERGLAMAPFLIIVRTPAHYRPQHDRRLLDAIEHAQAHRELLVLDDVFRLVDCRDHKVALREILELTAKAKAPVYSVLHRQLLGKMRLPFVRAQIGDRVRAFRRRSAGVKAGLERSHDPDAGPRQTASESGVRMKKRIADERAARLLPRIELARASLPLELQSSHAAIAKALNEAAVPTPSGLGRWQGITVKRVLDRVSATLGG